jgi:hypothetical protein
MNRSEDIKDLALALSLAQGEIVNPEKNAVNPYFSNATKTAKYSDLAEVLKVIRPVFSKNGLSFIQLPAIKENSVSVETILMHKTGQFISETITSPVPPKKDKETGAVLPLTAQAIGSVITYLRRYSLAAFAGVAQEDDDGNSANGLKAETKDSRYPALPPEPDKLAKQDDFL